MQVSFQLHRKGVAKEKGSYFADAKKYARAIVCADRLVPAQNLLAAELLSLNEEPVSQIKRLRHLYHAIQLLPNPSCEITLLNNLTEVIVNNEGKNTNTPAEKSGNLTIAGSEKLAESKENEDELNEDQYCQANYSSSNSSNQNC